MILLFAASVWLAALVFALSRRRANDLWRDVVAVGGIGAATAGFFWRLLAGQVWMPAGGGDLAQFLFPTYAFAAEWWQRGIVPLWNPYLFTGMPFVGDIQSGIFYPLNLLTFFLSNPLTFRDMEFLSILHFFVAGFGMYALLRWGKWRLDVRSRKLETRASDLQLPTSNLQSPISNLQPAITNYELRISIPASLAGAIAFEFSDLFITHFGNLNLIAAAAWTPLVLLFYRRAVLDRRAGFATLAGIFLALAFFAGHAQAFLFSVIALVALAVYHLFSGARPQITDKRQQTSSIANRKSQIENPSALSLLAVTVAVAIGLSAPSLLPVLEMTQQTTRVAFSYAQAAQYSLPPAELIGLLAPGFFGRGPQNAWGPWDRVEVGYIGILPLMLALLAIVLRRDSPTKFFGALALVGLALALGGYAILYGWLYQLVPGFSQLRAPARFIFLFDFALAALAAMGFDYLLRALPRASEIIFKRIVRALPWAFLLIALPVGLTAYAILILGQGQDAVLFQRIANAANALAFFILLLALSLALILARATRFFRPRAWAIAALALIGFDLFSLGAYVDASADDPARVYEHPDAVAFFKSDGSFYRVDPRETGVDNIWTPDTSILYQLFDVNGDNPLVLADFDRYWQALGSRSSVAYDLLNAKYLLARKNAPVDRAKFKPVFEEGALAIYENTRVLPRAFIVPAARVVASHAAALDALRAPDFDPTREVVLEKPVNSEQLSVISEQSSVKIVGYGPNEILLETNSASTGILVLSEVWYPDWKYDLTPISPSPDVLQERGAGGEVLRANYLFRAIELPAGAWRVRLLYEPGSFKVGLGFFATTVIVLIVSRVMKQKTLRRF
ncbi:MAG: YfhO family protein [Chloroflexi bacterium]|nr:YfhO family protein [Chloroflexota bacterium]